MSDFTGEDTEETALMEQMFSEAVEYIAGFRWCEEVISSWAGNVHPGIVAVYLMHIVGRGNDVPDWVWVIVGDLPSAYLSIEDAPNAAIALDVYVVGLEQWVMAVRQGRSVEDLMPMNVPPTPEYADMLDSRIKFLRKEILPGFAADLAE